MKHAKKRFKRPPGTPRRFLSSLFLIIILIGVLGIGSVYGLYHFFARDLPDLSKITGYRPALDTEVYSHDGRLVAEFYTQRRKLIQFEEIPAHVKAAFIAIEDQRFFEHKGLDLKRIIAAFIINFRSGKIVQGASTITQQVVKNLVFSSERNYTRKIKEAILSYQMERSLTKNEILYIYLNHIYFGDNAYGIESASINFFGKSAREINIPEAALLAALPKAPEKYSLRRNLRRALTRQDLILRTMHDQGIITDAQLLEARAYEIQIADRKNLNTKAAPFFVETVRQHLENKVGTRAFLRGGYKVFTTLDVDLSLAAQWALRRNTIALETRQGRGFYGPAYPTDSEIKGFLARQGDVTLTKGRTYDAVVLGIKRAPQTQKSSKHYLYTATLGIGTERASVMLALSTPFGKAVPVLDNTVSSIFAPAGGYWGWSLVPAIPKRGDTVRVGITSTGEDGAQARIEYDPKTQGAVLAMDSTGFIKTLVGGYDFRRSQFNRAIQAHRQPGSSFKPIVYAAAIDKGYKETSILYDIPVMIQDWTPKNYDESLMGAVTLRKALSKSRNLASVRLILEIDPEYTVDYASRFGFVSKLNPYPSLVLGGSDLTLIEMVKAYNVFATGGLLYEPRMILRIYDRDGKLIEDNTAQESVTSREIVKADRELKRLEILNTLAQEQITTATVDSPGIGVLVETNIPPENKPGPDTDEKRNRIAYERSLFLTPEEFLELIRSGPASVRNNDPGRSVMDEQTAYIMVDMLRGVITEGTGRRAKHLNNLSPVAGKTGTTNDFTDAWFIGFSPKIVTGVWVGRDNHLSLGKKESGSRAALPLWTEFMDFALRRYKHGDYDVPDGIQFINTPYGFLPFKSDSFFNPDEVEVLESHYSDVPSGDELDFIMRR